MTTGGPCPTLPLVEARRDRRLGPREEASLERHLAGCATCRARSDRLARMAAHVRAPLGPQPTALERQRRRGALLRAAALPDPPPRWPWGAGAAALAIAVGVALAGMAAATRRPAPPPLLARLAPGVRAALERAGTVIAPSAEARFERTTWVPPESPPGSPPGAAPAARAAPLPHPAARPRRGAPAAAASGAAPAVPDGGAFQDGVGAIERGDYAAAARQLGQLRDADPAAPHAEDAAYLAVIALQRAGQTDTAAAAARRFLDLYPASPRRAAVEALLETP
jgi:hypothetical protein